jgi:hypothetical protein
MQFGRRAGVERYAAGGDEMANTDAGSWLFRFVAGKQIRFSFLD